MNNIWAVDINLIDIGARLRPVDDAVLESLAASIKAEGLLQPIGLRRSGQMGKRYTLIWGAHRLAAAKSVGGERITARVYEAKDMPAGVSAVEMEALENLSRAELSPYDRAMTVTALRTEMLRAAGLEEGQSAKALGGMARHDDSANANLALADLASRIGASLTSVNRDLKLAKNLQPTLATSARGKDGWTNASVVIALSKLKAEEQLDVAEWLVENPEATLKDALASVKPFDQATLSEEDRVLNAIEGRFARVMGAFRPIFVARLFAQLSPAHQAQVLADLAVKS